MEGSLRIIQLFSKDLSRALTIRQISQLIKKSYAYTNKEVWELINKDIINKKEIGKSLLCSLNISNPLTRTLLAFNDSLNKRSLKEEILQELKEKDALTAFYSKNKLYIVSDQKFKHGISISKKETKVDVDVVYGFEKFWEIIEDNNG